jgi:hypothetical protein
LIIQTPNTRLWLLVANSCHRSKLCLCVSFMQKPALCGHDVQVSYDSLIFLGHTTVLDQKQHIEGAGDNSRREALTTVTFVLVVREGCRTVAKWKEVVQAAGNVWFYEEQRCGYVSSQIQLISESQQEHPPAGGTGPSADASQCSLAAEVRALYESLREFGVGHILVNSWLNLHVSVSSRYNSAQTPRKSDTLLLLQPRETILSEMPADCSIDLALLVQRADPLKTIKVSAGGRRGGKGGGEKGGRESE